MGFTFVAVQAASYAEIPPADNGRASAIFSTQRQMSVSIGIALMATVLTSFTTLTAAPADPERGAHGYHWTFAVAAGLALIAALLAFLTSATRTPRRRCNHAPDRRRHLSRAGRAR